MAGDKAKIAGIVLAGGKSSRMGTCKALMEFQGRPMVDHMAGLLRRAGCADVHISGDVPGHTCIPDLAPHSGPARAICDLLRRFQGRYDRLLFVPVDMPLIPPEALARLFDPRGSSYYTGYPLPASILTGGEEPECESVKEILARIGAEAVTLPEKFIDGMANANTPAEWERVLS